MSLNLYCRIAGAALGVLWLTGCDAGDSSGSASDGGTADVTGGSGGGPGQYGASDGLGSSGEPSTSGATTDYDGDTTDEGPETTGASVDDSCVCDPEVDCGFGSCEQYCEGATDDAPTCNCEPPAGEQGPEDALELGVYDCVSCDALAGPLEIDIDIQSVKGRIFINGEKEPPPVGQMNSGKLFLYNPETGDTVFQAHTNELAFDIKAISGIYDVTYSVVTSSGGVLPWNKHALLERVGVSKLREEADDYNVTVTSKLLHGVIQVKQGDGELVDPAGPSDDGNLYLRNRDTGDEIYVGKTSENSYTSLHALAGAYELIYEVESPGATMPRNHRAVISSEPEQVGNGDTAGEVLDITIPVVVATGEFKLNGAPAPGEAQNRGKVMLRDPATEDVIELGETDDGTYSIPIVPGTYQVLYTGITSSGDTPMPMNAGAVIDTVMYTWGDAVRDINITASTVSGDVMLDGVEPPALAGDDGELWLEAGEGDADLGRVYLGTTAAGTYEATVIDGVYDLYYAQETASDLVPVNTHARLAADVQLPGGISTIPIDTILVEGDYTINGQPPALSGLEDARVFLKHDETGDSVLLGYLSEGGFSRRVVKGDYTVYYALESGGDELPVNVDGRVEQTLSLHNEPGDESGHVIDIPVVTLTGSFKYNGDEPPTDGTDYGLYYLVDRRTGDEIYLGASREQTFTERVLPGDYLLYYRHGYTGAQGSESPRNSNALIRCVSIAAP